MLLLLTMIMMMVMMMMMMNNFEAKAKEAHGEGQRQCSFSAIVFIPGIFFLGGGRDFPRSRLCPSAAYGSRFQHAPHFRCLHLANTCGGRRLVISHRSSTCVHSTVSRGSASRGSICDRRPEVLSALRLQ